MNESVKDVTQEIESVMQSATLKLAERDYLASEMLCEQALSLALEAEQWHEAARIVMPIQECRRIRRQYASTPAASLPKELDAAKLLPKKSDILEGEALLLSEPRQQKQAMYLWQQAREAGIYLEILCVTIHSDQTEKTWDVSGLLPGNIPPLTVPAPDLTSMNDEARSSWFQAISEKLGDMMLAAVTPETPLPQQIRMLQSDLLSLPDHEKLLQQYHDSLMLMSRQSLTGN